MPSKNTVNRFANIVLCEHHAEHFFVSRTLTNAQDTGGHHNMEVVVVGRGRAVLEDRLRSPVVVDLPGKAARP